MYKNKWILLLQPKIGDMDEFRDRPTPPISLLAAASLLKGDYEVVVLDQRLHKDWKPRLISLLRARPLLVGLTAITGPPVGYALEMAKVVREFSDVPIVWGGVFVTLTPEISIRSDLVDMLVVGEGEYAFKALVEKIDKGEYPDGIKGVWYKKGKEIIRQDRAPILDFKKLPLPYYGAIDMEPYLYTKQGKSIFHYQSSRGCPYKCIYCYNNLFFRRRWNARTPDQVMEELKFLKGKYNFESIYFLDDNFLIDRKRGWEIVKRLPVEVGGEFSIQGIDIQSLYRSSDDELNLLERSGMTRLTIGIESGNNRIRKMMGKWGTTQQVLQTLKRLANKDYIVLTSFLIGLPFETWEETKDTVRFAIEELKLGRNFRIPQFFVYTPMYGTPISDMLVKQYGFDFPETMEEYAIADYDHAWFPMGDQEKRKKLESLVFLSKFMDRKDLDYGSKPLVSILYRLYRPIAWSRLLTEQYSPLPEKLFYEILKQVL